MNRHFFFRLLSLTFLSQISFKLSPIYKSSWLALALTLSLLVACGGGDDSVDGGGSGSPSLCSRENCLFVVEAKGSIPALVSTHSVTVPANQRASMATFSLETAGYIRFDIGSDYNITLYARGGDIVQGAQSDLGTIYYLMRGLYDLELRTNYASVERSYTVVLSFDYDRDGDGIPDKVDNCPRGETGWTSTGATDHDGDGCRDADEDGDGVADAGDLCPSGVTGWRSDENTDRDGDGCR